MYANKPIAAAVTTISDAFVTERSNLIDCLSNVGTRNTSGIPGAADDFVTFRIYGGAQFFFAGWAVVL